MTKPKPKPRKTPPRASKKKPPDVKFARPYLASAKHPRRPTMQEVFEFLQVTRDDRDKWRSKYEATTEGRQEKVLDELAQIRESIDDARMR